MSTSRYENSSYLFTLIYQDNESIRLFQRCGFEQTDTDGEWLQFVYEA